MTNRLAVLALALAAIAPGGILAGPAPLRVGQAQIRVMCPMTVGGSFDAKTTALSGALTLASAHPAAYSGELAVDLRTLDTGIDLRNDHLRNEYLEVGKGDGFDKAVLSAIRLGDVDPNAFQGRTSFSGTLLLHGVRRPVTGQANIRRSPASTQIDAKFPVTLTDYSIAKPQYLGIGVKNEVQVTVSFVATPVVQETSAR